jgi:hypothetical protein
MAIMSVGIQCASSRRCHASRAKAAAVKAAEKPSRMASVSSHVICPYLYANYRSSPLVRAQLRWEKE